MFQHVRCHTFVSFLLLGVWAGAVLGSGGIPLERLSGAAWTSDDAAIPIGETRELREPISNLDMQRRIPLNWDASGDDVRSIVADAPDVTAQLITISDGNAGHPTLPPCDCESWEPWYVGVDGGYAFGINDTPNVEHAGFRHDITAFGTHLEDAGLVNVRLGRRLSPCWRADFSYTMISGNYDWRWFRETNPGTLGGSFFDSSAVSHLLLVNGYRHLFPFAPRCGKLQFDPYVGAGIGMALNRMAEANQTVIGTNTVVGTIFPETTACFAARFSFGSQFWLTSSLALDLAFTTTYVGNIESGANTLQSSTGNVLPIGRYDFHENWIGAVQVGFVWYPQPYFWRN